MLLAELVENTRQAVETGDDSGSGIDVRVGRLTLSLNSGVASESSDDSNVTPGTPVYTCAFAFM